VSRYRRGVPEDPPPRSPEARAAEVRAGADRDRAAAAARIREQGTWVDLQITQAIDRGDFRDLPGYGKPLRLSDQNDPDWWVKRLVEREKVVVAPPSVQLRREDAELDDRLDRLASEAEVRREVAEFNDRVRWALYRPPEGPPVVTARRDPDQEVARWRERREARVEAARTRRAQQAPPPPRRRFRLGRRTPGG
jgi:hypothetical protein